MNKNIVSIIAVCFILFLSFGCSFPVMSEEAQQQPISTEETSAGLGAIWVNVYYNYYGQGPINGALVIVNGDNGVFRIGFTGLLGNKIFSMIPIGGTYTITASASGYDESTVTLTTQNSDYDRINIELIYNGNPYPQVVNQDSQSNSFNGQQIFSSGSTCTSILGSQQILANSLSSYK